MPVTDFIFIYRHLKIFKNSLLQFILLTPLFQYRDTIAILFRPRYASLNEGDKINIYTGQ